MKKITLALLSKNCTQPKFYLQTHEQTPVVLDLTNDLAAADTMLQFASPSAPVISPMRESPVPEPPMPVPSAWHTKVSKKRLRFLEKEAKRMKKVKIALQKKKVMPHLFHAAYLEVLSLDPASLFMTPSSFVPHQFAHFCTMQALQVPT